MALAISSLPAPVSPEIRTEALLPAIFLTFSMSCCIDGLRTTAVMPPNV
jgi:hypothetical protein